ncbi:MAG: SpoIIE family protein phosphatase [Bacteroidota bacterium]|nr:SpoIIE family protein phosphatase [Bacteroidota bacterium]
MNKYHYKIKPCLYLIIASLFFFSISCNSSSTKIHVNFKIILKKPLSHEKVYLTGSNSTLGNWNPSAVLLDKQSDSVWTKKLVFEKGDKLEFKFTLGSWKSEAVNADGWILDNFSLIAKNDTTFVTNISNWKDHQYSRIIKPVYIFGKDNGIILVNNWRYHEGDNPEWAGLRVNDTLWKTVESNFTTDNFYDLKWQNIGWFRTHLHIDPSLWNKTLGLKLTQLGASDIYYNGRLIYSSGKVGNSEFDYSPSPKNSWKEITLDPVPDHVIAVRYANYKSKTERSIGFDPGFSILLMDLNSAFNTTDNIRSHTIHQMVFTLIPLILSFLHLFLFFFYIKQRQNLYYAICLLGFSGLTFFNYERFLLDNVDLMIFFQRLNVMSAATAIFFALLTLFEINYHSLPKRWRSYLALYVIIFMSGFLDISPRITSMFIYFSFTITLAEGIIAGIKTKAASKKGTWIIFIGFIVMSISIVLQIFVDFVLENGLFGVNQIYVYGMIGFIISMSLYLSYNFAYINKDLEWQLDKVKVLSRKTIEQERIAASLEIERRVIEAENLRKTKELESARELQLSLLPKEVPQLEDFEISCYMKTASEVGGDYYDFHVTEDNALTVIIGDATGHGLKASNMVILAKGLFNTLVHESNLISIMNTFNRSIKQMNLHMLTMCMALIRVRENRIEYSSAGMPPMLIYRNNTGEIEQFLLKGMPLGAFYDFPYKSLSTDINKGDVMLLMSDGLVELFNKENDTYGLENVIKSFKDSAKRSVEETITHICKESTLWSGEAQLKDDITILALKKK